MKEGFERIHPEGFAASLLESFIAAELDARTALSFSAGHAGTLEIVGTIVDVPAKLLLHLGLNLRAVKESGSDGTK